MLSREYHDIPGIQQSFLNKVSWHSLNFALEFSHWSMRAMSVLNSAHWSLLLTFRTCGNLSAVQRSTHDGIQYEYEYHLTRLWRIQYLSKCEMMSDDCAHISHLSENWIVPLQACLCTSFNTHTHHQICQESKAVKYKLRAPVCLHSSKHRCRTGTSQYQRKLSETRII